MKNVADLLTSYERYHTKKMTKITHFIGVPLIYFSVLIWLSWVRIPIGLAQHQLVLAWVFVLILLAYYFWLDVFLGFLSTLFLLLLTFFAQILAEAASHWMVFFVSLALFIIGWAMQLIGHHHEGNRPAFLNNFMQVFVAPLFLIAELATSIGYKKN